MMFGEIIQESLRRGNRMTYKDLVKRLSLTLDGDKMLIWSDGEGWSNLEIEIRENDILLLPSKNNSPFSSEN